MRYNIDNASKYILAHTFSKEIRGNIQELCVWVLSISTLEMGHIFDSSSLNCHSLIKQLLDFHNDNSSWEQKILLRISSYGRRNSLT